MKDFGVQPYLFPMPTYMIGTYNEDGSVDVMMMAWGGICAEDMAVPGADTVVESDFLGIATSNKMADKFERTGLHAVKSERVDAPIITEYPLTLECKAERFEEEPYGLRILGRIVNVMADESVLDEKGKIDAAKLNASAAPLSPVRVGNGYYAIGEKIGQAWSSGAGLMKNER